MFYGNPAHFLERAQDFTGGGDGALGVQKCLQTSYVAQWGHLMRLLL